MLYILGRWSNPSFFNLNFSQNFARILGAFMGIVFGSGAVDKIFSKKFSKSF